ncbi:MAG: diphthine--ammonia ligase [Methanobacteriota archaeon]
MTLVASWSGGKDSCLACYKSISNGFTVSHFLNMISEEGMSSGSHGLDTALIADQAQAIGIPIVQRRTTWDNYENEFKKAITDLKQLGVDGAVFGDIYLQEHKDWLEKVCRDLAIEKIIPLWKRDPKEIIDEFIDSGFKAIVVGTKAELLGEDWLGREIDRGFVNDLEKVGKIDLCGELGEYHTFVYDGPLFKRPLKLVKGARVLRNGYWSLHIPEWQIV